MVSPAEMGKIMFENFSDYKYAIKKVIELDVNTNDINIESDIECENESESENESDMNCKSSLSNQLNFENKSNTLEYKPDMLAMPYSEDDPKHFSWDNSNDAFTDNELNYSTF